MAANFWYCKPIPKNLLICWAVELQSRVSACIDDVLQQMKSNRLQLNATKTEFFWCSSRRQHKIPTAPLMVGSDAVRPVQFVQNLGMCMDLVLTMRTQIFRTVSSCFSMMRQILRIWQSVTIPVLLLLVVSLVLTRLKYGSVILDGLPRTQLDRLQSVVNTETRLMCSSRKYDNIPPLNRELHWLWVPERIDFQMGVIVYRCPRGQSPHYLTAELHWASNRDTRRRMGSSSTASLVVPRTKHSSVLK